MVNISPNPPPDLIAQCTSTNELLGELQVSFIVFLLGHVYSAFEHWKLLVDTMCRAEQAIVTQPTFYKTFIRTLHFHLKETPRDFFVDIVSRDNFLVRTLKVFFENLLEVEEGDRQGVKRIKQAEEEEEGRMETIGEVEEDNDMIVTSGGVGGVVQKELRVRAIKFRTHLENYYSWDFSTCDEDDPVVVEM